MRQFSYFWLDLRYLIAYNNLLSVIHSAAKQSSVGIFRNRKIEEGKNILQFINRDDFVCLCDVSGKMISSIELSTKLGHWIDTCSKDIVFVIGGSQGVSEDVRNRSDFRLSFSLMTFPHQLMRVVLLEQIYRAFMINNGRAYHK